MTPADGFNRLKNCRRGLMLYNRNDFYIGRSLEVYGEFCEDEVSVFDQLLRPGMTVLDIGANIGAHTVYFAKKVVPNGIVIAFEPQRVVFQTLCANMALNSVLNVQCRQVALGETAGKILVPALDYAKTNNFGGLSLDGHTEGEPVEVARIDDLNLPACHFMKIDVEGMEQSVLAGGRETIARFRPILYVENDRKDRSAQLIQFLDALGYHMHWHFAPLFRPSNFLGHGQDVFGNIVTINMICAPKELAMAVNGFEPVSLPMAA
jgi:FkbM family methyltransferase